MQTATSLRIMIADDYPILRRGLIEEINDQQDMHVVAEATNGHEAVHMYKEFKPDVSLIDLRMPGLDGVAAIGRICAMDSSAKTIILSTTVGDVWVARAFQAGARNYLLKNMARNELTSTIRTVSRGQRQVPPEVADALVEHALNDSLSDREISVLREASYGNSNKMIADHLQLSEHTVKTHFKNILSKLRANDRTHAVTIALRRGFFNLTVEKQRVSL